MAHYTIALVPDTEVVAIKDTLASGENGLWRVAVPTELYTDAPLQALSSHNGSGDGSDTEKTIVRVRG